MLVLKKKYFPSLFDSFDLLDLSNFDREFNYLSDRFFQGKKVLGEGAFLPSIDISKSNGKIVLTAELPGIAESDLDLSVEDGVLTLKGEKKYEKESKKEDYYRAECSYGTFQRSFTLPKGINVEKIEAKLKDGVLKVAIPQPEVSKPKAIPVNGE